MLYLKRFLFSIGVYFMIILVSLACKKDGGSNELSKGDDAVKEEEPLSSSTQIAAFENLGPQVYIEVLRAGTFAKDPSGTDYIYTVMEGEPGHLVGFEVQSGKVVVNQPIEGSESSWDLTVTTDGYVYIAGGGKLYRHLPGGTEIENLGTVLPGQKMVWALAAGLDGVVYGTTWPGCQVFKYDSKEQKFTTVGGPEPIVSGQDYARSLVYHKNTNKLYVGTGIPARLIELDPVTGQKRQILSAQYQNFDFVYDLGITQGISTGDKLFVWLTRDDKKQALIIDPITGNVEQSLPHKYFKAKSVIKSPLSNVKAYFSDNMDLFSIDLSQPSATPIRMSDFRGTLFAVTADPESYLKTFSFSSGVAEVMNWKPMTGMMQKKVLDLPGQPTAIRALTVDPQGKVWSARGGAVGVYNPKNKSVDGYAGILPTMSMAALGDKVYFGGYPGAIIYEYDINRPWDINKGNPKSLAVIGGQDRPFAGTAAQKIKRVYFGTVPGYGKNGGALVEYDQINNTTKTFDAVIPGQSVVSLAYIESSGAYDRGLLVGGTSIYGGLGVNPTESEAKLFIWDINTNKVVYETIPMPRARIITGLVQDGPNTIWGVADGTLFTFDLSSKTVKVCRNIHTVAPNSHIWENANLVVHPSGDLYGTAGNKFFRVSKDNSEFETLYNEGQSLTMDDKGDLYMVRRKELWRYIPSSKGE